jgi:hypothetical protein
LSTADADAEDLSAVSYLQYRQITDDLMNQPALVVKNFIQANPTLPPARTLKSRFVNELARRRLARTAGVQPGKTDQHRSAV